MRTVVTQAEVQTAARDFAARLAKAGVNPDGTAIRSIAATLIQATSREALLNTAGKIESDLSALGFSCSKDLVLEASAAFFGERSWNSLAAHLPKAGTNYSTDVKYANKKAWSRHRFSRNYVDSRGAEMERVPFSDALWNVLDLAHEAARADVEADVRATIMLAKALSCPGIETLLDDVLAYPDAAQEWPSVSPEAVPEGDVPISWALRRCLWLAEQAAVDPMTVSGIEEAESCDEEQRDLDLVRDLLGMNAEKLDKEIAQMLALEPSMNP